MMKILLIIGAALFCMLILDIALIVVSGDLSRAEEQEEREYQEGSTEELEIEYGEDKYDEF